MSVSLVKSYLSPHKTFRARNGVAFCVRLVRRGDTYGSRFCLTHDESNPYASTGDTFAPMVEFFDTRYRGARFTPYGQFTGGRYYVSTTLGTDGYGPASGGLNLNGDVPTWQVDADTMHNIRAWLRANIY